MKTEKEKMLAGELYRTDKALAAEQRQRRTLMDAYNAIPAIQADDRRTAMFDLFGKVGHGANVRSPVYVDYGFNIRLGDHAFLNFGCVLLDVALIEIGDETQIGPNVQILTADHPRDPGERATGLERGLPVKIGRNVWIGGGAIILPGVSVGDDATVGAGAVVTRDVPKGATVAGNPARVLPQKRKARRESRAFRCVPPLSRRLWLKPTIRLRPGYLRLAGRRHGRAARRRRIVGVLAHWAPAGQKAENFVARQRLEFE